MKNVATLIILVTINSLICTADIELANPKQDIINITITQQDGDRIINYQLNNHLFSFNAKILTASSHIKNVLENRKEPLEQPIINLTKLLFDGLEPKQISLLIKALQRNTPEWENSPYPSQQAYRFVKKRNSKNQQWILKQAKIWSINYIYRAACLYQPLLCQAQDIDYGINEDSSGNFYIVGYR